MESETKTRITIEATVHAPAEKVWNYFTAPEHVSNWNFASEDWHCPHGECDLRNGGKWNYRMEAKDGSFGFDFWGIYDEVVPFEKLFSTMGDGRKLEITFIRNGDVTQVIETFEAETQNPEELQRTGWQMILNSFKKYTETN